VADLRFAWDVRKNATNKRKHGIGFEEAQTAFYDERALVIDDPAHSENEMRFVLLGLSSSLRLLVVLSLRSRVRGRDPNHLGAQGRPKRAGGIRRKVETMRKNYDFSKARRNPYAKRLKRQVTIRLDADTIAYFNGLAEDAGIPYQTLINLYLRDCAQSRRRPTMRWRASGKGAA
jgi:uncharacterized DUF497 family protein/uncharacterized protein (DUF4415 family)